MDKIRILIADDHAVVREGTREILEHEPDMSVVAEASNGEEAVLLASTCNPDVAIVDIAMPILNGIEATKRIKTLNPGIAVMILTAYDDDEFIFSVLEAGAAGYLLKSVGGRELIEAVRAVCAGESVLHPAVIRKLLSRFEPGSSNLKRRGAAEVLSSRELEVLKLATGGLSNKEIAHQLYLGVRTVETHMHHIFNKLQVSSRTEAVVRALQEGWFTTEDTPPGKANDDQS